MGAPDYGYALQPAKLLAQCPYCARLVEVIDGRIVSACQHARQAQRIESNTYVEFREL